MEAEHQENRSAILKKMYQSEKELLQNSFRRVSRRNSFLDIKELYIYNVAVIAVFSFKSTGNKRKTDNLHITIKAFVHQGHYEQSEKAASREWEKINIQNIAAVVWPSSFNTCEKASHSLLEYLGLSAASTKLIQVSWLI